MDTVKLVTSDGGFIARTRLGAVPWRQTDVVLWGQRMFVYDAERTTNAEIVLREALPYVIPPHEVDRSLDLVCPEHGGRFVGIERHPGGRRVCEHGESWRVKGGTLTRV